jgi:hypothetical protein
LQRRRVVAFMVGGSDVLQRPGGDRAAEADGKRAATAAWKVRFIPIIPLVLQ